MADTDLVNVVVTRMIKPGCEDAFRAIARAVVVPCLDADASAGAMIDARGM